MQTRTSKFDQAVIYGGRPVCVAYAKRGGTVVLTGIRFESGSAISIDGAADIRRTLSAVIANPAGTLAPNSAGDPLAPFGSELVISVGFTYADGTVEALPAGVFRIEEVEPTSDGAIRVAGVDRSALIAAAKFETPYSIAAGTNVVTAAQALITSRLAGLSFVNDATTTTVGPLVLQEGDADGDPWVQVRRLLAGVGMECFFQPDGSVRIRNVVSPSSASSVWDYAPGVSSLQIGASNRLSTKDTPNVVVVTGESSQGAAPVRATAEITDVGNPLHPANVGSRRVKFIQRTDLTTTAQCQTAATGALLDLAGASEVAGFTAAPHPAHEAGDVVHLSNVTLGLDAYAVLSSWVMRLDLHEPARYTTAGRRSS